MCCCCLSRKSGRTGQNSGPPAPGAWLTVQTCQGAETNMGPWKGDGGGPGGPGGPKHCLWALRPLLPDTNEETPTDRRIYCGLSKVHGCVVICLVQECVGSKRGGRWEMTSVLCLYYRAVPQDQAQAGAPRASFVNYVRVPAMWVCLVAVPEEGHGP